MLLPKTSAICPSSATAALPLPVIITILTTILHALGPVALPLVESWLAGLNLPPATLATIDALLERILKATP